MIGPLPAFGLALALGLAVGAFVYRALARRIPGRDKDPLALYSLLGILGLIVGRIGAWILSSRLNRLLTEPLLLLRSPNGSGLRGSAGFAAAPAMAAVIAWVVVADVRGGLGPGDRLRHLDALAIAVLPPAMAGLWASGLTGQLPALIPDQLMVLLGTLLLGSSGLAGLILARAQGSQGLVAAGIATGAMLASLLNLIIGDAASLPMHPVPSAVAALIFATLGAGAAIASEMERRRRPGFLTLDIYTE